MAIDMPLRARYLPYIAMSKTLEATSSQEPLNRTAPSSRLARNILSNWTCYVFSMALNFFVAPYVVRHLGNEQYGVWTIVLSLTGYLGLLDLGVRGAVTRYTARY